MQLIPAELENNSLLVGLILFYAIIDMLAWSRNGILRKELLAYKDTRNQRMFNMRRTRFTRLRPLLFSQYYLFFGLCLFTIAFPNSDDLLRFLPQLTTDTAIKLAMCIAVPLLWYMLHCFFQKWGNFIFGGDERTDILLRIYKTSHMLAGQFVLLLFTVTVIADFGTVMTTILLIGIFIITQLVFILYGFKLFLRGFWSLCLIFVYLCALEIAPLAVFLVRIGVGK